MPLSWHRRACASVLACASLLSACTQVRIYSQDTVSVHNVIGIAEVSVQPGTQSSYVETSGAGFVLGRSHLTLGWMDEAVMTVPDARSCQAIIIVNSQEELTRIEKVLDISDKDLNHICLRRGPKA